MDNADNAAGTGPEVLYADNIIVPAGSTLDLNGFQVYARGAQIDGTVINGAVQLVPDGENIPLNRITTGNISTLGEVDDWIFFGRAGQAVTVFVGTGTASNLPPLNPSVVYAQVTILDPNGNVLGTINNITHSGANASLFGVPLPVDGTYHVRVQAPSTAPNSTGYYNLTVADATVHTAPLTIDETTSGQLANSYSVDHWTFSAVAEELYVSSYWPPPTATSCST